MSAAKWGPVPEGRREARESLRRLHRGGGREAVSLSLFLGPGGRLEKGQAEGALVGERSPARLDSWLEEGPLSAGNESIVGLISKGLECQSKAFASN